MRGLKLFPLCSNGALLVASFTDAWIETSTIAVLTVVTVVASFTDAWIETRALAILPEKVVSHLLQMRGLKRETDAKVNLSEVASFTDAWIETRDIRARQPEYRCRIFYRCVD